MTSDELKYASNSTAAGKEYQVAWIEGGKREVAWVAECEIEWEAKA